MNKNQNLLKAPKISYKVPKKLPSFLDLNNNVNKIEKNYKFVSVKRKESASTKDSDSDTSNVNNLESFESNQKVNEDFIGIGVLDILKTY